MLCNVCDRDNGWGRVNQYECSKCSSDQWIYDLRIVLILVAIVLVVLVLFKMQYNPEDSNLSAYSRIFFDYVQILSIVSLYLTNFDFFSEIYFEITRWVTALSAEQIISLECKFQSDCKHYSLSDTYFHVEVAFLIILPLTVLSSLAVVNTFTRIVCKRTSFTLAKRIRIKSLFLTFWLFYLPLLATISFQAFRYICTHS